MAQPPAAMRGHVIVCGATHIAVRTVGELALRGQTTVVVAPHGTEPADIGFGTVPVIFGDQRRARVLRDAGAERAAAVVLTDDDDHANLDAALAAHEINPELRLVIRLFDAGLGDHLRTLFPRASVLSSSALAAPGFVSAAVFGDGGERFELGGRLLISRSPGDPVMAEAPPERIIPIARLRADRSVELLPEDDDAAREAIRIEVHDPRTLVAPSAPPADIARPGMWERMRGLPAALRNRFAAPDQRLARFAAILVALFAVSSLYFLLTAGVTPLDAISYAITLLTGASLLTSIDPDTAPVALKIYAIFLSLIGAALVAVVYAFITDALIRSRLLQTLGRRSVPASVRDHVIVCGLGSIGFRVAAGIAELGVPAVVIEPDEDGRFVAPARALGIPVVIGDARQRELLIEVGLLRARALVAATSNDLINLSAALNARDMRPGLRVVVRLYDPDFAARVQSAFQIQFARSVSHLAAPAFAAAAIGSEVVATLPVGDRRTILFARLRVPAGSALEGASVAELQRPGERRIIAVADPGSELARWEFPADEVLDPGEEVVVVATRAGLGELLEQAARGAG